MPQYAVLIPTCTNVPHKMKDVLPFTVFESNSSIGHDAYYNNILLEISREKYRETKNG